MLRLGEKYRHLIHGGGCACQSLEVQQASLRLERLTRRALLAGAGAALIAGVPKPVLAQASDKPPQTLFRQARLFDGTSAGSETGVQVLVEGSRIAAVDRSNNPPPAGATVIDCGDRFLMPGMIDAHWHTLFAAVPVGVATTGDPGLIYTASTAEAERTLLRGFTTVRDLGGPVFTFKQAIDTGTIPGPRIYPSGAFITTSGGHGDLRMPTEIPRDPARLSIMEQVGGAMLADSLGEVQMRVREQLLQGASQIKVMGGGGVSSPRSPLDMTTFSEEDLRAAVAVARDWNTYVAVHAYAPQTVQRAVNAGAACIEHAHLMDEATAALMAEKGAWLSTQPFLSTEDAVPLTGPSAERLNQVIAGTPVVYELARKHGLKLAWGSDMLFSPAITMRQNTMLTHLSKWYSGAEILKMVTSTNAELLGLSGPRNPYPAKLGVVEPGAFADLLLVDGNPLEDIALLGDPQKNLAVIMKDGRIHKNTL
ncbi:amidohydrolase family protein (plasmid) [Rhizobium sp. TRM96647]|uniref:metal-dependent hydrolase family protein n=1 Tax=unclassified Rhizobium TaxID=2613769 RepID=UPI0021E80DBC|nr:MULTISPECIES: amidohydrolase family protein [unclassified Rhizobium]MCV3735609.1 amidohydrolase family protein [Rhizobium sp. TRM96647]MCV3757628.1 amidohydrolase family protein [Rhizobium sp. TRM96650]